MTEADLCKLRDALSKDSLPEAIKATEETLRELGWRKENDG